MSVMQHLDSTLSPAQQCHFRVSLANMLSLLAERARGAPVRARQRDGARPRGAPGAHGLLGLL